MNDAIETTEVMTAHGNWKVQICGEEIQIVDHEGRTRYRGRGRVNLAATLAGRLAEMDFRSHPTSDAALRMAAERFPN